MDLLLTNFQSIDGRRRAIYGSDFCRLMGPRAAEILSCRMGNVICPQITGQLSANPAELGHYHEMYYAYFRRIMGPRVA